MFRTCLLAPCILHCRLWFSAFIWVIAFNESRSSQNEEFSRRFQGPAAEGTARTGGAPEFMGRTSDTISTTYSQRV